MNSSNNKGGEAETDRNDWFFWYFLRNYIVVVSTFWDFKLEGIQPNKTVYLVCIHIYNFTDIDKGMHKHSQTCAHDLTSQWYVRGNQCRRSSISVQLSSNPRSDRRCPDGKYIRWALRQEMPSETVQVQNYRTNRKNAWMFFECSVYVYIYILPVYINLNHMFYITSKNVHTFNRIDA